MHYLPGQGGHRTLYEKLSWLAIAAFLCATIVVELAVPFVAWQWTRQPFLGVLVEHTLIVTDMRRPDWAAANMVKGRLMRLVAVGGQPVATDRDLARVVKQLSPGEAVTLTLQPRDGSAPVEVSTVVQRFALRDWAMLFWLPYGVGLLYVAIGVWVFVLRGDQRAGQSFALFCAFVSLLTGTLFDISTRHLLVRLWVAVMPMSGAALVHLALVFPDEGPVVRRWPLFRFVTYPIGLVLAAILEWRLYTPGQPWAYIPTWRWCYEALGLAIIAFFGLMLYARARTLSPIVRQQVRIILLGSILAFAPVMIFFSLAGLAITIPFQTLLYLPALVIFPVAIAYAILRYRLLGMDLVVSRGLAYSIVLVTVGGAYLLAAAVLGQTLGANLMTGEAILLALMTGLLVLSITPLRRGMEHLTDRLLGWRRFDYRHALQTYSRDLATVRLDLPAILRRLLTQVEPVSHSAPALIFLFDPRRDAYTPRQASGFALEQGQAISFPASSSLAVWLVSRDLPIYLPGDDGRLLASEVAEPDRLQIEALGLVLFLPLRGQDRLEGWLALGPRLSGEPYTPDDIAFLAAIADQTVIVIENAQLFAALERRVEQLDALRQIGEAVDLGQGLDDLLAQIYIQTRRVLQVDNFYVALYDATRERFTFAYYVQNQQPRVPDEKSWPLGRGLASEIVRRRQPVVTDDYLAECERRGIQGGGVAAKAWLGVPLIAGDEVIGILNVSSFQPGFRYATEQVQILSAIADQAASAIERVRLYQETSARAAELATLNEVSQTINSTLDLDTVLDLIMNKAIELLDIEAGSLLMVDEESGDLVFQVALGTSGSRALAGRRHPAGRGIAGHVAQTGRAEIINDVQSDPRWNRDLDKDTGLITRSILCVPMISRERVIGVIEAMNHRDGTPFEESEAALLIAFAAQAAVAIENARLYTMTDQALARRVEELSTMQRIDRELNAALDFNHVMDMTLEWALRVTGATVGVIGLVEPDRQGMLLLASRGYPPEMEEHRLQPWPLERGVAGRVIRTGEPSLINDVTQDPDYYPALADTRSQLTVPIRREETVVGVVDVESPVPGAFDDEDLAFLRRLADHAAIAIENARLYSESQRWAEEMALLYDISLTVSSHLALNDVLEAVYTRIRDVWQPPVFFIALYDREDDALDFLIYVDRGERLQPFRHQLAERSGLSAWIVRNRQPLLIRDWQAESAAVPAPGIAVGDTTRSWLGVPLLASDQMVGVMAVQAYEPDVYNEDHRRFLATIASQVAIAIDNARLYQETQQRLRELTVLFDTSASLSVTLDVNVVLDVIASQVTAILGADGCVISRWDHEQESLVDLLNYSPTRESWLPREKGTTFALANYPASQRVLATRLPFVIRDGDPNADPAELTWMREYGIKYMLMVPMVVRDQAVGLLEPVLTRQDREFTPTDIGLVQTMANLAAAALENARLYEGVSEANQAKSEFIDFVAHELKQPMTSIQGYARMLAMGIGGEMTPMQKQFVQVITSNVDRMGKLVNDLLEISRLEAGRIRLMLAPVQLQEVVEETVTNTRTEIDARHHTLELDVAADLPPVMGDRERLVQILTNLVSNAYKYTPDGGTIRITVDGRDEPGTPSGQLVVCVSDTGIGMSPQELVHLEEKFFRADHPLVREQPGTGLGVSITRRLVTLHGGEFSVESQVGQGSKFKFTVPMAA